MELLGPEHAVAGMAYFPGEIRGCCTLSPGVLHELYSAEHLSECNRLSDNVMGAKQESRCYSCGRSPNKNHKNALIRRCR